MMPHEELQDRTNSVSFLDAATGECLSGYDTNTGDVGRGVIANIDPNPGFEYWASGYPVFPPWTARWRMRLRAACRRTLPSIGTAICLPKISIRPTVTKPVVGEEDGKAAITGNTTR